jgi:hypothetical protein
MRPLPWLAVAALAACVPDVSSDDTVVRSPRILAVKADPAEARPGAPVTYTPLVASPEGSVPSPFVEWSYCLVPKPLTEDNAVASVCLVPPPGALPPPLAEIGAGASVTSPIPLDACSRFGPVTPAGGTRPRDPDSTGGYYQPLRVDLEGGPPVFALERVTCDLAEATAAVAAAFAMAYAPNENPSLGPLEASLEDVPAGAHVELTATWAASSAETYAYYDAASGTVTTRRESLLVAWYATAGSFDRPTTARGSDDPATTASNGWTAPAEAATVHLWIVLRDSRGGVDFAAYDASVVR